MIKIAKISRSPVSYWYAWVDRRAGKSVSHRLHHKNLYVLPSAAGWSFLILALVVWLLGTNYQNNLILALAYLQLSLLVVVILHTYKNVSGLTIECLGSEGGYAGGEIAFRFRISPSSPAGCHNLYIGWRGAQAELLDVPPGGSEVAIVYLKADRRGRLTPPSLGVRSQFPMGLVKCWTWLGFDCQAVVFPQPKPSPSALAAESSDSTGRGDTRALPSGDEFFGYRTYRPGDSPRHIAWKQYARERGLYSKAFGDPQVEDESLHWQHFFKGDVEMALSQMTFRALELHRCQRGFALTLPSTKVSFGADDAHLTEALTALALHGQS